MKNLILKEDLSALATRKVKPYSGATYMADIRAGRMQDLLAFIAPGVYVENGTQARLTVSPAWVIPSTIPPRKTPMRNCTSTER